MFSEKRKTIFDFQTYGIPENEFKNSISGVEYSLSLDMIGERVSIHEEKNNCLNECMYSRKKSILMFLLNILSVLRTTLTLSNGPFRALVYPACKN